MNPEMLQWLVKKKKNDLILIIMNMHRANMNLAKVLKNHAGILELDTDVWHRIHAEGEE